jgi:hypothetical protein
MKRFPPSESQPQSNGNGKGVRYTPSSGGNNQPRTQSQPKNNSYYTPPNRGNTQESQVLDESSLPPMLDGIEI